MKGLVQDIVVLGRKCGSGWPFKPLAMFVPEEIEKNEFLSANRSKDV